MPANNRRKMTREERARRNEKKARRRLAAAEINASLAERQEILEQQRRAESAGIVLAQPGDLLGIPQNVRRQYGQ